MIGRIVWLGCLILSAVSSLGVAAIHPSFRLDDSAWQATDILVATRGKTLDGAVSVIGVWKGQMSPGESLNVTDLKAFATEASRTVWLGGRAKDEDTPPVVVSGERMVLFLRRSTPEAATKARPPKPPRWRVASRVDDIKASVVWIESDGVYVFRQVMNPGPSVLIPYERSEEQMRMRVRKIAGIQTSLAKIGKIADASERAEKAASHVASDVYHARREAFRILATCKTAAVPLLRKMLADKSQASRHPAIVDAMAEARGAELGPEFTALLAEELQFWKAQAPALPEGWWNGKGLEWGKVRELRSRYSKTLHVLYGLQKTNFAGSRRTVEALRDYWRSLSQLEGELGQMSQACDAVLQTLDPKGPSSKKRAEHPS